MSSINRPSGVTTPLKLTTSALIDCGQNRISSRSISWNSTGAYLSMACNDRNTRIWSLDTAAASAREVLVVSGHTGPVTKTRFHPSEASVLCTAAHDKSIRLWDVRNATQRATGKIDLVHHALSLEWSKQNSLLIVTDRNGTVAVYDTRKLSSTNSKYVASYDMNPYLPEVSVFAPNGTHVVAGVTHRDESIGEFRVWPWKQKDSPVPGNPVTGEGTISYAAHSGPIYALQFSPNGKRLASGGSDSTFCLWETASMCCMNSFGRQTKYICSVSFSEDSQLLAASSEDDGVDIVDATTGGFVETVSLSRRPRAGGAEEVAFHPKASYLLACARSSSAQTGGLPVVPVTVAKISITKESQ